MSAAAKPASLADGIFRLFRFNVLSFAMRLVSSAIVARVMGPEGLGVWLLLSLLPSYAEGFGRLKVDVASIYVLGKERWTLGEVATALVLIATISGTVFAGGLLLAKPWIVPWLFAAQSVPPLLYVLTVASIPFHFIAMSYAYLLLHLEDVRAYNVQNFLRTLLPSVVAVTLLLATPLRVEALVLSLLLGGASGAVYSCWQVHRREPMRRISTPGLYTALLQFARRLYLSGLIEHLNLYLSSLVVGVQLAPRDLAFFRLGQDRLQLLDQIPSAVNTLIYPRIAKASDPATQSNLVATSMRTLVLILGACGVLGAVLALPAVWLLYGKEFVPAVWSIWALLPGVCALGMTSPATQYFMGSGRPQLVWRLALVALLLQISFLWPLIRAGGFIGAAVAVSSAFVVHAIVRVVVLSRVIERPIGELIVPTRADLRAVAAFIAVRAKPVVTALGLAR